MCMFIHVFILLFFILLIFVSIYFIANLCLYDVILNIKYHFEKGLMADDQKLNEQPCINKDDDYFKSHRHAQNVT